MHSKKEWLKSHELLDGYYCVIHNYDKTLNFFGHRGQIWSHSSDTYSAVIWAGKCKKSFLPFIPKSRHPRIRGDEVLFQFKKEELYLWLDLLEVPRFSAWQMRIANKKSYLR